MEKKVYTATIEGSIIEESMFEKFVNKISKILEDVRDSKMSKDYKYTAIVEGETISKKSFKKFCEHISGVLEGIQFKLPNEERVRINPKSNLINVTSSIHMYIKGI